MNNQQIDLVKEFDEMFLPRDFKTQTVYFAVKNFIEKYTQDAYKRGEMTGKLKERDRLKTKYTLI